MLELEKKSLFLLSWDKWIALAKAKLQRTSWSIAGLLCLKGLVGFGVGMSPGMNTFQSSIPFYNNMKFKRGEKGFSLSFHLSKVLCHIFSQELGCKCRIWLLPGLVHSFSAIYVKPTFCDCRNKELRSTFSYHRKGRRAEAALVAQRSTTPSISYAWKGPSLSKE